VEKKSTCFIVVGEVMRSALRLRLDDGWDDGSAFVLLETGGRN
jgi:hypothetical protein